MQSNFNNIPYKSYIPQNYVPSNGANTLNLPDKQQIKNNVANNVNENPSFATSMGFNDPKVALGALCFWPALMNIVRPINNAISGEFSTSLLGKIGNFGDKIFNTLKLGRIFSPENSQRLNKFLETNNFTKYFTKGYATKPVNSLVRSIGTQAELANDAVGILTHLSKENSAIKLSDFFSAEVLKNLGITEVSAEEAARIAARRISPADYSDDLAIGLHRMAEYCKANNISESFSIGKVIKRNIKLTELRNKLISIAPKQAEETFKKAGIKEINTLMAKTPLGRGLAKNSLKTLEGLTNGMAGGPFGIIFQAFCFAQAVKEAVDAPKGEKFSTFMHVVTNDLGIYLLNAASKDLVYQAAGNKYRGMTKEGLKAFRDFLVDANTSNLSGQALKIAKAQRKLFLNGVKPEAVKVFGEQVSSNPSIYKSAFKDAMKNAPKLKFWEKPLKLFGNILGAGLDSIKGGKLKKLPTLKGFSGGALRFMVVMFVVAPILLKPVLKLCHMVFGTPTAYLKKEKGDKDTKNDKNQVKTVSANDFFKEYNEKYNNITEQSTQNNDTAALSPISINSAAKRYIPDSRPAEIKESVDRDEINRILKRGEIIEKEAMKYL